MPSKSDRRLDIEESLPQLFSERHRIAYKTAEIMEIIDIDIDRRVYIEVMRGMDMIKEYNEESYTLWIFPRMREFRSYEDRLTALEEEIE